MYRSVLRISFLIIASLIIQGTAYGQSCAQLTTMLEQSQFYTAPASSISRYNKAIKTQRKFLVQVNSDLRRYHCNQFNHSQNCVQLRESKRQMEANLAYLNQELALIKSRPTEATKRYVRKKLAEKGCLSASFVSLKRTTNNNELGQKAKLDIDQTTQSDASIAVPIEINKNQSKAKATGKNWTKFSRQTGYKPESALTKQSDPFPTYTLQDLRVSQTQETPSVTNVAIKPDLMIENEEDQNILMSVDDRKVRKVGPTFLPEREIFFER